VERAEQAFADQFVKRKLNRENYVLAAPIQPSAGSLAPPCKSRGSRGLASVHLGLVVAQVAREEF
jgi:hypothetical protein